MYLSFAGKSKVLPELYWLRSFGEHLSIKNSMIPEPKMTFQEWWNSNNEKNEF